MLYLQYAHEWFTDPVNFSGRQTRGLDQLPEPARKLVRRLDARRYVEELEARLREAGVDVANLRSQKSDVYGQMDIDSDDGLGVAQAEVQSDGSVSESGTVDMEDI